MFYQNVRGLRSKLVVCKQAVLLESADIYAFTETFLISSIHDGEVFPLGYSVLRRDRAGDAGWGGVLLAVRDQYKVQQIVNVDGYSEDIEVVIGIITLKLIKLLCCVVYIPPNSKDEKYLNTFILLENLVNKYPKLDIVIFGDFNLNSCSQNVQGYPFYAWESKAKENT